VYTGLRPGEKLYEELLITEDSQQTRHPRILTVREPSLEWAEVQDLLRRVTRACDKFDCEAMTSLLRLAPLGYEPAGDCADLVWHQSLNTPTRPLSLPADTQSGAKVVKIA
jgi:FlaA1/EpsC-like NDP-sugar epimerase